MKTILHKASCLIAVVMCCTSVSSARDYKFPLKCDHSIDIEPWTSEALSGVYFSGRVTLKSRESVVRVILTDEEGQRYLVSEIVAQYCAAKDTVLVNDGLESSVFPKDIVPAKISVAIHDADVEITDIQMSAEKISDEERSLRLKCQEAKKEEREQCIVDYINDYNTSHEILWLAQKNHWSKMSYANKQASLGFADESPTWGYEYYGGGIFLFGATDYASLPPAASSGSYVEEFSWRNRHGVDWMTPVKDQMIDRATDFDSNCCWAFAAVGVAEARANLYYNQLLNLDLSEEYVITYSGAQIMGHYKGGNPNTALSFLTQDGVIDEPSFPFGSNGDNSIPSSSISHIDKFTFDNAKSFANITLEEDTLKKYLINEGPLVGTLLWKIGQSHAMALAGYKIIHAGDSVYRFAQNGFDRIFRVPVGHWLVGTTCWDFKNSYGAPNDATVDGYLCASIPYFNNSVLKIYSGCLTGRVDSERYTDDDIVVEDADGDGYYNWGIGPKPAHAPSWIPDERDGDDSDASVGPIDEFGFCVPNTVAVSDITNITSNTTYTDDFYLRNQIWVRNGATLTIQSRINMYSGAMIHVENGGKLILDGGCLNNASLDFLAGSEFEIKNGGTVIPNGAFNVPLNVKFTLSKGDIVINQ